MALWFGALLLGALTLVVLIRPAFRPISQSRLNLASPARLESARAALREAEQRPLVGVGPGNVSLVYTAGGQTFVSPYAHDEYLQVLAALGTGGLVLVLALWFTAGRAVRRGRDLAPSPEVWAGAVGALCALAVHSGADFLWQFPVIPLIGAVLVGLALPAVALPAVDISPAIPTTPGGS